MLVSLRGRLCIRIGIGVVLPFPDDERDRPVPENFL